MTEEWEFDPEPPPPDGNPMGLAGFILSLVGLALCGLISPIALIFSILGLRKEPKGLAVAGTVISAVGCLTGVAFGLGALMVLEGVDEDWLTIESDAARIERSEDAVEEAADLIEQEREELGRLPSAGDGNLLISAVTDGWERSLMYVVEGGAYEVISAGPDAEFFNEDDIYRKSEPPKDGD